MNAIRFDAARVPIREPIRAAHERLWARLARPGSWFTGAQRVAIAEAVRAAWDCALCAQRKDAVSPNAVPGAHDGPGTLAAAQIEMIHRVTTDPARLSRRFYDDTLAAGLSDAEYVETLGLVVQIVSVDTFCRGVGAKLHPLPAPEPGEPDRWRPPGAAAEGAWVPMIAHGAESGPAADLYAEGPHPNVGRALSLVPDGVRGIKDLAAPQYMSPTDVANPAAGDDRTLSRAQMELIAGRVSAIHECFY